MGRMSWAVYMWPGLLHVWKRGAWSGLAMAVGFALLLNLTLVTSFIWTELEPLGAENRKFLWWAVAAVWVGSAAWSFGWDRRHHREDDGSSEDNSFAEALYQYLQQDWYEAERSFNRLLRRDPRDLDARLMLASVLRHSGRWDEAAGQLDRLGRIEGSQKWELEIRQQRQWLADVVSQNNNNDDDAAANSTLRDERLAA